MSKYLVSYTVASLLCLDLVLRSVEKVTLLFSSLPVRIATYQHSIGYAPQYSDAEVQQVVPEVTGQR